jgi:DNA primase
MRARESTQKLNGLTLDIVGNLLGIKLPAKGMARCPLPNHDDGTPSFEVRHQGRRWVCYACDLSGGAIDLVMAYNGMEFMEAKKWLAEKSGYYGSSERSFRRTRHSKTIIQPPHSENDAATDETPPDHNVYKELLVRSPLRETGIKYLQNRGLSKPVIDRFSIGQMPNFNAIQEFVGEAGFDRIRTSGLLTKQSTPDRFWPILPPTAILFPFFEDGKISYFQSRGIDDSDKSNRWRNLNHRRRRIYNIDALKSSSIGRIAICEGVLDALSSIQLGCEAIGFIGVSATLSESEMTSLRGKQVDLLLDWDDAGEKRASELRNELARFGVAATRKTAPRSGAKDVNDFLREGRTKI